MESEYLEKRRVTFTEKKANHFYAKRENGVLVLVKDPKPGDVVFEVPVVAGGSQ